MLLWADLPTAASSFLVDTVGELMTAGRGPAKPDADLGLAKPDADLPAWLDSEPAQIRLRVWTAIGMVNVALLLTTAQALDRLRGYAYSHNSTIDAVADSLTTGRLHTAALNA